MHPLVADTLVRGHLAEQRRVAAGGGSRWRGEGAARARRAWQHRLGAWLVAAGLGLVVRAGDPAREGSPALALGARPGPGPPVVGPGRSVPPRAPPAPPLAPGG